MSTAAWLAAEIERVEHDRDVWLKKRNPGYVDKLESYLVELREQEAEAKRQNKQAANTEEIEEIAAAVCAAEAERLDELTDQILRFAVRLQNAEVEECKRARESDES